MTYLKEMLNAHPEPVAANGDIARECIEACSDCAEACTICADACLHEDRVAELTHCIRLNLDCADICQATGRILARPGHTDALALQYQLQACAQACRACAEHCEKHSELEHCRICAEACRHCEGICDRMASVLVP